MAAADGRSNQRSDKAVGGYIFPKALALACFQIACATSTKIDAAAPSNEPTPSPRATEQLGGLDEEESIAGVSNQYAEKCTAGDGESCYYASLFALSGRGARRSTRLSHAFATKGCLFDFAPACELAGFTFVVDGVHDSVWDANLGKPNPADGLSIHVDLPSQTKWFERGCQLRHADSCAGLAVAWACSKVSDSHRKNAIFASKQACDYGASWLCGIRIGELEASSAAAVTQFNPGDVGSDARLVACAPESNKQGSVDIGLIVTPTGIPLATFVTGFEKVSAESAECVAQVLRDRKYPPAARGQLVIGSLHLML
jgi:hypothetical protein